VTNPNLLPRIESLRGIATLAVVGYPINRLLSANAAYDEAADRAGGVIPGNGPRLAQSRSCSVWQVFRRAQEPQVHDMRLQSCSQLQLAD
jgi:hypothetical protein